MQGNNGKVIACTIIQKLIHVILSFLDILKSEKKQDPNLVNCRLTRTVSTTVECWSILRNEDCRLKKSSDDVLFSC